MSTTRHIALYGKGGSGKSTTIANLAVLFAQSGRKVLLVGCDPKHDTSQKVCDHPITTVLDRYRERADRLTSGDFLVPARHGITCVESGGPEPGIGCAGRGISKAFELFDVCGVHLDDYDVVLYDVLGDVVCGGFAVPLRASGKTEVMVVVSGEIMALYAANNICRALDRLKGQGARLVGFVGNLRGLPGEEAALGVFAERLGAPLLPTIPRDPLIVRAERDRRTVVEHDPDAPVSARYRSLFQAVDAMVPAGGVVPRPLSDIGFEEFVRTVLYATAEAAP